MDIILNGAPHELNQTSTVAELVAELELSRQAIAVAVNRCIIARPQWEQYQLQQNDLVDVVRAIGGG